VEKKRRGALVSKRRGKGQGRQDGTSAQKKHTKVRRKDGPSRNPVGDQFNPNEEPTKAVKMRIKKKNWKKGVRMKKKRKKEETGYYGGRR